MICYQVHGFPLWRCSYLGMSCKCQGSLPQPD